MYIWFRIRTQTTLVLQHKNPATKSYSIRFPSLVSRIFQTRPSFPLTWVIVSLVFELTLLASMEVQLWLRDWSRPNLRGDAGTKGRSPSELNLTASLSKVLPRFYPASRKFSGRIKGVRYIFCGENSVTHLQGLCCWNCWYSWQARQFYSCT